MSPTRLSGRPAFAPIAAALLCGAALLAMLAAAERDQPPPAGHTVCVTDYFPPGYVRDGSVSYQPRIQAAIDEAARRGAAVVFPPMTYLLDDAAGLRVHSNTTLTMHGARIVLDPALRDDGQAFLGQDVTDVQFIGGEIAGRNDSWPAGVNIRGIYLTGPCRRVRIRDMTLRDLSSNGVGVFGAGRDDPARDVWLLDTIIDHCCNVYGDYQAPPGELRGPEKGSQREDQGLVAFYYVDDFVVRGCRFENSRSDGTHFYMCRGGQFSDNRVYGAKMGGYFVESCDHVLAVNNVVRGNGSRGVTIERGSRGCTLLGNTVELSGREGLWMPDCTDCLVSGNLLLRNGRKPNGAQRHHIWNANITINESRGDPTDSPAQRNLVAGNLLYTTADQVAAIRVDTVDTVRQIVIRDNVLFGDNRRIVVDGDFPDRVRLWNNDALSPPAP